MRQSPPAAARSPSADLQRAEFASEVAQLRIIETLVAKHHHRVAVDRLRDRGDHGPIDTLAKIDAADSGDEVRLTGRISMAMRPPPSALAKIRRATARVDRSKFVAPCRDRAHGGGELTAKIRQRQRYKLLFKAECHDAVHGREQGAREDAARVPFELRQQRRQWPLNLRK